MALIRIFIYLLKIKAIFFFFIKYLYLDCRFILIQYLEYDDLSKCLGRIIHHFSIGKSWNGKSMSYFNL